MKDTLFILIQHLVPQHLLSRFTGMLADSTLPWIKNTLIRLFTDRYDINMSEALEEDPFNYPSFNAFFTRALKPDARPLDTHPDTICSPADGAISQLGHIDNEMIFQAKGRYYGLNSLLGGDRQLAAAFKDGHFATIYLSPRDYHRVHMPVTGTLRESIYVPGQLFSVNQTTAEQVDQLFARNERLIAIFDTEYGPMAMILVGAMIVAGIETVWAGQVAPASRQPVRQHFGQQTDNTPLQLEKGQEMGRFKLGSTVILLFGKEQVNWASTLAESSPVQLGEAIAHKAPEIDHD